MKIISLLAGIFLGVVLSYNIILKDINYRITFYGYKEVNGELLPIIKLRKKLKNHYKSFHYSDGGINVEIGTYQLELGKGVEFTDDEISEFIKNKYCV